MPKFFMGDTEQVVGIVTIVVAWVIGDTVRETK